MEKSVSSKITALILNLIVVALCAVSIAGYFLSPFFKVKAAITFNPELCEFLSDKVDENGDDENQKEMTKALLDQMGKDGVKISVGLTLNSSDLFSALNSENGKAKINDVIDANVADVMAELDGTINTVVGSVAKTTTRSSVKEVIKKSFTDANGNELTIEANGKTYTVDEALTELGITDDFIDDQVTEIVNSVMQGSVSVDELAEKTCDAVENAYREIANSDSEIKTKYLGDLPQELTDEDRQKVKDTLTKTLQGLGVDTDATINGEDLVYTIIGNMLADGNASDEQSEEEASVAPASGRSFAEISLFAADGETETPDGTEYKTYTKEDVQNMISEKIKGSITEDDKNTLVLLMQISSFAIIGTLFTWAWLIIKIIVKLFMKNPMIKLWLPLWFGNLPFWALFVTPNAVLYAALHLGSMPAFIKDPLISAMGAEAAQTFTTISSSLSITVSTCAVVAFAVSVALIIFSIFYCPIRRKLKRSV